MKELFDPNMVERVMLFFAVVGPLVGLIAGLFFGAHEKCALPKMIGGLLIGALFTVAYGMWRVYGLITGKLSLDSVWNLYVQLVIFAVAGVLLGAVSFRISNMLKRRWTDSP